MHACYIFTIRNDSNKLVSKLNIVILSQQIGCIIEESFSLFQITLLLISKCYMSNFRKNQNMSRTTARELCATCKKNEGVAICRGCERSFCLKHFSKHRQELAAQMDNVIQEYDSLRQDLGKNELLHPVLEKIREWKRQSVERIQKAAEQAERDVYEILDRERSIIEESVAEVAGELKAHQESNNYTESDLFKWSEELKGIRKSMKTIPMIELVKDDDRSTLIHLRKVHEQKMIRSPSNCSPEEEENRSSLAPGLIHTNREKFCEVTNCISLSGDGFTATLSSDTCNTYQTIFGEKRYSSGVHYIQFRIEKKGHDNFFFGIVNNSQPIESKIFDTKTANGWWGFDYPVVDGKRKERLATNINTLQKGDIVLLKLDCDKKIIQFEHERTQTNLNIPIKVKICPCPWKIAISLSKPGDSLRILS